MSTPSQAGARIAQPDYQQRAEQNATATAAQAAVIVTAYRAGRIERPDLPAWLGPVIRAGAARAVSLADVDLSSRLAATIGRPVPTVGLTLPAEAADQIEQGIDTVLADTAPPTEPSANPPANLTDADDELATRVGRLASAAPLAAGQTAQVQAMAAQGVPGWTRRAHPDCCALCQGLADGTVVAISKSMWTHPNDRCVAEPVLTGAQPRTSPETGPNDPADFVPRTLTTGQGISGRQHTQTRPGLRISRDVFIPAARRTT